MGRFLSSARGPATWTLRAAVLAAASAACVCPPDARAVLDVGFRTPEQAFRTFQTATRLDDPDLELRCFSLGFRARNHLSQLTWREARAELYERKPWMRAGIAGADVVGVEVRGDRAQVAIDTAGGDYVVWLVREDFAEAWAGAERVLDEGIDWRASTGIQDGASGGRWMWGRVAAPPGVDADAVTDLRFGREWKIDDVAEPVDGSSPRREVP